MVGLFYNSFVRYLVRYSHVPQKMIIYGVNHKERDVNDDLKLLQYADQKVELDSNP